MSAKGCQRRVSLMGPTVCPRPARAIVTAAQRRRPGCDGPSGGPRTGGAEAPRWEHRPVGPGGVTLSPPTVAVAVALPPPGRCRLRRRRRARRRPRAPPRRAMRAAVPRRRRCRPGRRPPPGPRSTTPGCRRTSRCARPARRGPPTSRRAALAPGAAPRGRRPRLRVAEPPDAVPERRRRPDAHGPRRPGDGDARDAVRAAADQRGRLRRLRRRDAAPRARGRAPAAAARAVAWPGWRSGSAPAHHRALPAAHRPAAAPGRAPGPCGWSSPPGRRPDATGEPPLTPRARYRRGST